MNNDCTIIVSSCDAFEDAWAPFFKLWSKYWPDCPYPICLITNFKKLENDSVYSTCLGDDQKWASNLKKTLKMIDSPSVIYLQEDYFLNRTVDTQKIKQLVSYAQEHSVACLKLFPSPPPDKPYLGLPFLGVVSDGAPYRISTQAALWDKKYLDELLLDGETGWDFELKKRGKEELTKLILSVKEPVIQYVKSTGIKKGRWTYDAIKLFKNENIDISTSNRPAETRREYVKRKLSSIPIFGKFIKNL